MLISLTASLTLNPCDMAEDAVITVYGKATGTDTSIIPPYIHLKAVEDRACRNDIGVTAV